MLVNHALSLEAQDALYLEHPIRLSKDVEIVRTINKLRKVEIVDHLAECYCSGEKNIARAINLLSNMSKPHMIILECNSLNMAQSKTIIRDFAEWGFRGSQL